MYVWVLHVHFENWELGKLVDPRAVRVWLWIYEAALDKSALLFSISGGLIISNFLPLFSSSLSIVF